MHIVSQLWNFPNSHPKNTSSTSERRADCAPCMTTAMGGPVRRDL